MGSIIGVLDIWVTTLCNPVSVGLQSASGVYLVFKVGKLSRMHPYNLQMIFSWHFLKRTSNTYSNILLLSVKRLGCKSAHLCLRPWFSLACGGGVYISWYLIHEMMGKETKIKNDKRIRSAAAVLKLLYQFVVVKSRSFVFLSRQSYLFMYLSPAIVMSWW